jgi:TonB family protein
LARRQDIPWGLWLGCLAAAVLAHAALLMPGGHALARSLGRGFEPRGGERSAFELELIAADEPDEAESLQFVAVAEPNERRPVDTARVAEHDSDVEQESEAPPVRAAAGGGPSGSAKRPSESAEPKPEPKPETPTQEREPELVTSDDGRLAGVKPTPVEQWRQLAGSPNLLRDNFAAPRPPAPAPERKRESLLDSRAHLYAAFYARMHERILAHYDCDEAIARHDPHALELGDQQRSTVLSIRLDRAGAIETLSFLQESGVEYLDAEAVRTVRAAGPYPNPPDGLFDADGTLVIRVAFKVNPDGSARVDRPHN